MRLGPEQGQKAPAPIDNRRYSKLVATPSGEWVHGSDCRESERARLRASPFFVEKELGFLLPSAKLRVAGEPLRWTNVISGSGRHGGEAASVRYFGSAYKSRLTGNGQSLTPFYERSNYWFSTTTMRPCLPAVEFIYDIYRK
jgi:hypothetical protein